MPHIRDVALVLAAGWLAACSCNDDRAAACVVSGEGAWFGAVAVGETADRRIEITNDCRSPTTVRSAEILAIDGVEFTLVEPTGFPIDIPPGASRDLVVRARPLAYDIFITEILVDGIGVPDDRPRRFLLEVDALCRPDGKTAEREDTDLDTVPDGCDVCAGGDDLVDTDLDGVPDDCDVCPDFDDAADADRDAVPDGCDACPGFDDALDEDRDGQPDACQDCVSVPTTEVFPSGGGSLVYPLPEVPQLDTLAVSADGELAGGWIFDRSANAVAFDAGSALATAARVTVDYVPDCAASIDQCSDGVDNDLDGKVDYPEEPGCATPFDADEVDPAVPPACSDGIDDDGDGDFDYPDDADCVSAAHASEQCVEQAADGFGYRWCVESFVNPPCPDLSFTAPVTFTAGVATRPLGFAFPIYGESFTEVVIGANGTLTFGGAGSSAGQCLPVEGLDRTLHVWGEELDDTAGGVWTRSSGFDPDREFAVQWRLPPVGGSALDVRAVLYESGDIAVCYVDSEGGAGSDSGASATAGLQGNGAVFLEASCDAPELVEGRLIRYLHP